MELQEFGNFYSVNLFQDQTLSITPTACTVNNAWWNPVLENGCRMVAVRQQVNRKAGLISPHEQKMKREYFVSCFTIQWQPLTIWLFFGFVPFRPKPNKRFCQLLIADGLQSWFVFPGLHNAREFISNLKLLPGIAYPGLFKFNPCRFWPIHILDFL